VILSHLDLLLLVFSHTLANAPYLCGSCLLPLPLPLLLLLLLLLLHHNTLISCSLRCGTVAATSGAVEAVIRVGGLADIKTARIKVDHQQWPQLVAATPVTSSLDNVTLPPMQQCHSNGNGSAAVDATCLSACAMLVALRTFNCCLAILQQQTAHSSADACMHIMSSASAACTFAAASLLRPVASSLFIATAAPRLAHCCNIICC